VSKSEQEILEEVWEIAAGALSPSVPKELVDRESFYAERLHKVAGLVVDRVFKDDPERAEAARETLEFYRDAALWNEPDIEAPDEKPPF
jgi:hypothetical protein